MLGDEYIKEIGSATAREVQMALSLRLFQRYMKTNDGGGTDHPEDEAVAIAAAVTNRVFGQPAADEYHERNRSHIEEECRKLSSDHNLCLILSRAAYCASYARYVHRGGSRGMFSNHFLTYIRALSKGSSYLSVQLEEQAKIDKLNQEILLPLKAMVEFEIFRPLPHNPDEREFYNMAHQFAVDNGVKFS
jgi:hypothetical protein